MPSRPSAKAMLAAHPVAVQHDPHLEAAGLLPAALFGLCLLPAESQCLSQTAE